MAWVAFDRAIKSAEKFGMKGPVEHWREVRQQIHDEVCRHGFDNDLGSFVNPTDRRIWMPACCW